MCILDATLLTATTCTVGDSFDLLLCNLATPGVIQLAGVAATGIASDVRIADSWCLPCSSRPIEHATDGAIGIQWPMPMALR